MVLAACGLLGIGAAAAWGWSRCPRAEGTFPVALPVAVQHDDVLRESFLVLADVRRPNIRKLERAARRCDFLLRMVGAVAEAEPVTVALRIVREADDTLRAVTDLLNQYYDASNVLVVTRQESKYVKTTMPKNVDLQDAHVAIMEVMRSVAHDVHVLVQEKMESVVSDRLPHGVATSL